MSAGQFVFSKYQADNGDIYRIRIQPETSGLTISGAGANTAPSGNVTIPGTQRQNFSRRAFGVKHRFVTLRFTGAVPDGYAANSRPRVAILTETAFEAIELDATGTYLGAAVAVVSKSSESVR